MTERVHWLSGNRSVYFIYSGIALAMAIIIFMMGSLIAGDNFKGAGDLCETYCNSSFAGYYNPYSAAGIVQCSDGRIIGTAGGSSSPGVHDLTLHCCREKSEYYKPCGVE